MPKGQPKGGWNKKLEISEVNMPVACVNVEKYGVVIMALNEESLTRFIKEHVKGYKIGGSQDDDKYDVEVSEPEKVE